MVIGGDSVGNLGYVFTDSKVKKKVMNALGRVMDPELGVGVVGLGLIYGVEVNKGRVRVRMSLTSMGCPLFGVIEDEIKKEIKKIKGVKEVDVKLVWDPPWHAGLMSEDVRVELGVD